MMIKVHACGKTREYPEGTPLFTVAEEFQPEFQEDILLARVNGKLKELHKTLTKESQIEFLTFQDPVGKDVYKRQLLYRQHAAVLDRGNLAPEKGWKVRGGQRGERPGGFKEAGVPADHRHGPWHGGSIFGDPGAGFRIKATVHDLSLIHI